MDGFTLFTHQVTSIAPASQDLATILSVLGVLTIPERLLSRAREHRLIWGQDGEAAFQTVDMVDVIQYEVLYRNAICDLCQLKAIHLDSTTTESRNICVDPQLLVQLAHNKDPTRWKLEVVKVVFYAFPVDRRLEPARSFSIATSLLPLLEQVLPFLEDIHIEEAISARVIEVCLAASHYSTLEWKRRVMAIAENISERFSMDAPILLRVQLRKRILSRLSSCQWGLEMKLLDFPRVDQRSNGYYGEFLLFNADVLFGRQKLEAALKELDTYKSWRPEAVSTLEKIMFYEIDFLRGKIYHFSGRFKDARIVFERIMRAGQPEASLTSKMMAHVTAVYCELGEPRLGISYASQELNDFMVYQSRSSGRGKRLTLALANANLMQGLWAVFTEPTASCSISLREDIQHWLEEAQKLFQMLADIYDRTNTLGRAGKTNQLSVLLGLAAIEHIKGDLRRAASCYDTTLKAARDCNWDAGYIEAIIYWSKSVIMYRLGELDQARRLEERARGLYQCRSYFFVGFGTLWPEIIGMWVAQQGRERVIPHQCWERVISD